MFSFLAQAYTALSPLADALPTTGNATYDAMIGFVVVTIIQTVFKEWRDYKVWRQKRIDDAIAAAELRASVEKKAQDVKDALAIRQKEEADSRTKIEETAEKSLSVNTENKVKIDKVYDSLNGDGISGMLKTSAQWQADHEKKDDKQHAETKQMVVDRTAELSAKIDAVVEAVRNNIHATRQIAEAQVEKKAGG